jgi:hypothetical protein
MGKGTEQSLFKGRGPVAKRQVKKFSTSLAIKETNQNHIKIPPHSFSMAIIKNTNNKCW